MFEVFGFVCVQQFEVKIFEFGVENVVVFIGELFQGVGGVIFLLLMYWLEIQWICCKYDILLVVDEVIGGFGCIGEWFVYQYFGFELDLIMMVKGFMLGYVLMGVVGIYECVVCLIIDNGEFNYGFMYFGYLVVVVVVVVNLKLLCDEGIVECVKIDIGLYFQVLMCEIFVCYLIVGEVYGYGMVVSL